ncbi:TniQ [compost metagenome]
MADLFKVPFFEDEIMTSYVSRIARANGRSSSYAFCTDLGLDIHAINRGEEDAVENFAGLLRVPSGDLVARALKLDEKGNAVFDGGVFGKHTLRKTKPGTCPECLAEDESDLKRMPGTRKYQRVSWLFADVRACVRHSCQLVLIDGFLDHRRMDFQLMLDDQGARVSAAPIHRPATPFEVFVCERLAGRKAHGDFLDSFSLSALISLCTLFGIAAEYGKHTTRRSLDDEQLAVASNRGFGILEQGEVGIRAILSELATIDKSINTRGGMTLYGRLYRRLLASHPGAEIDRIRTIVREYTVANIPLLPGSDVFGPIEGSPWRTVSDVARESNIATSVVYKLLEAGGHRVTKYDAVPEVVARSITNELAGMVDGKEACNVFGAAPTIFAKLVASGFIPVNGAAGNQKDGTYTPVRRYPRAELLRLRESLIERANSTIHADMLPVSAVARLTKVPAADILAYVRDGELKRVAYREGVDLLHSLYVVPRQVFGAAFQVDGLSSVDAAARLGINRHSILALRTQNHIQAVRVGNERNEAYIFPEEELACFDGRFVSLPLLERETGISQVELRRRMRVKKVIAAITAREAIYTFIHRLDAQKLVMEDAWVTQREMPGTVATVEEITDARQAEFGRIGVTGPLFKRL